MIQAIVMVEAERSGPGVKRTHTIVAFEACSRHDLEALFSLGQ